MTTFFERRARLVALTLLGAAAIVPALLARRLLDANATHALAEQLRARLVSTETPGSGDSIASVPSKSSPPSPAGSPGVPTTPGDPKSAITFAPDPSPSALTASNREGAQEMVRSDLRERFEEALSRGSLGETAIPVRFFSKYEIDQAVAFARASAAQPENGSGVSVGPEVTSPSATDGATGPTGGAPTGSAPGAVLPTNLPGGIQASPRNAGEPELLPPMGVVAQAADDGVRIAWADDPGNLRQLPGSTSVALLRTEIWRWIGSGVPKLIAVVPLASDSSANPPSNPMPSDPARPESRPSGSESTIPIRTFVDREPCAGMRVLYALRTVQIDRVEGVEVRHSASSPPAPVTIPIRFEVQPLRFVESSESRLAVRIVDRRRTAAGPIGASADATLETTVRLHEEVGSSTAFATGWTVRQIERELRTEVVEMAIPLFEADGSRTVTEGAPVFRILAQEQPVAYPVITIVDRCGNERTLRAPWTLTSKEKATDPRR